MNAIPLEIQASSRASVKCGDSFYTVEYTEKRALKEGLSESAIQTERDLLWDTVNKECDDRVIEILATYKK